MVQTFARTRVSFVCVLCYHRGHKYVDLFALYTRLIPCVVTEVENPHERLSRIRGVVHALPHANFDLLKRVAEHLDKYVFFLGRERALISSLRPELPTLKIKIT